MHQQLLGHLLGALDDDEQQWLDAQLEHDEERRVELARWRRRLAALEALRPEFEPPPGLAERTCRLAAAYGPSPTRSAPRYCGMSPDPALPGHAAGGGWMDMMVVAAMSLIVVALMAPALHDSRFHARVASCQDRLRQLGMALAEYSHHQGDALGQLADDGKLTRAGLFAAERIRDHLIFDAGWSTCPDAWLAAQGALCVASHSPRPPNRLSPLGTIVPGRFAWEGFPYSVESFPPFMRPLFDSTESFPYTAETLSDDLALLSDVPDVSSHVLDGHGGQGHNLFFEDGHVDFVPSSTSWDTAEPVLFPGDPAVPEMFTPAGAQGEY